MKKLIVIGGGYAGFYSVKKLLKFAKKGELEITLINKTNYNTLLTELHETVTDRITEQGIRVSLREIFPAYVNIVVDSVLDINPSGKSVKTERNGELSYDYLVVATGAKPNYFGIKGLQENSFPLWSFEDAMNLRKHITDCFIKATTIADPVERASYLTFVVAGGGFTGVEMVGELAEKIPMMCEEYGFAMSEASVKLVEANEKILLSLPDNLKKISTNYLKKIEVDLLLGSPIINVEDGSFELKNGKVVNTKTLIWSGGIAPNNPFEGLKAVAYDDIVGISPWTEDKVKSAKLRGKIPVNEYCQMPKYPNIYAAGDVVMYFNNQGKPSMEIVENAMQTSSSLASSIANELTGGKVKKVKFNPMSHGFMVSIGGKYATASLMGMNLKGMFAMLVKHLVNMHYWLDLMGVNGVSKYLVEHFWRVPDRRHCLGNMTSATVQTMWLIPFRMYLGIMWVLEGYHKIGEGWFKDLKMPLPAWYTPDTVSAASEVAEKGASKFGDAILSSPLFLYDWIMAPMCYLDSIFPGTLQYMQDGIVCVEIALGLAFLSGTFTFLAGAVSFVMTLVIVMSAMAGYDILWFTFASFVMMSGAGRSGGLDHWVMPFLKNFWNKTSLAHKTKLYFGNARFKEIIKFNKK